MKRALIATFAAAALAVPATAGAHHGRHHHHALAKLSGTGTLASAAGSMTSAKLGNGTFASSVTTTGAATTRTGDRGTLACAPATAALTLTGSSATRTLSLTGKSCTWTPAGSTASTSMFFGRGSDAKAFLVARSDGSVRGAVFTRLDRPLQELAAVRLHVGDCDGH